MSIKLSIIIPVYNSHEIVKRQALYFSKMDLPDDVEFIFVDDGSNPPLRQSDYTFKKLMILSTENKNPWTQGLARNYGALWSLGNYILFTDIDHILSYDAIMCAYGFEGDKMIFPREFAVLLEDGTLTQDLTKLIEYGLDTERYTKKGLWASYHGNTYVIRKTTFDMLGGYDPKHCQYGHHAGHKKGEDSAFNQRWNKWAYSEGIQPAVGTKIYMFPIGRYHKEGDLNPLGLFHGLSQEQVQQPMKGEECTI